MTVGIRILGLIAVFAAVASFGFFCSARLKKRADILDRTDACLEELSQQVRFSGAERSRVLNETLGQHGILIMTENRQELADVISDSADRKILEDFLSAFGSGDLKAELDRIRLCRSQLDAQRSQAHDDVARRAKLYRTAGLCGGAALCLLLW